jgi:hypothetical protein
LKIAFTRILNSELSEPYTDLDTDVLYFTDKGYVYPEGSSKPIDQFDVRYLEKLGDRPATIMNDDDKVNMPQDFERESFMHALEENLEILSYVSEVRYATLKGCSIALSVPRNVAKEKMELLETLKIVGRYGSNFVINEAIKQILEFELNKKAKTNNG